MFSKWLINLDGYDIYKVGEDCQIYRLPYCANGKHYSTRRMAFNADRNTWTLNGKPWTKSKLRDYLILDPKPMQIFKTKDLPF